MMSLGNREGRATMKQSRKTYRISYAGALWCAPLHPAMDRTAGFFRVKIQPPLSGTAFLRAYTVICVILGEWK